MPPKASTKSSWKPHDRRGSVLLRLYAGFHFRLSCGRQGSCSLPLPLLKLGRVTPSALGSVCPVFCPRPQHGFWCPMERISLEIQVGIIFRTKDHSVSACLGLLRQREQGKVSHFSKVHVGVVQRGSNTSESLPKVFSFVAKTDLVFQIIHSLGTRLSHSEHTPLCLCSFLDNSSCQIWTCAFSSSF